MRIPLRAAAGAVLAAATLLPAAPAPASDTVWICSYYRFDEGTRKWVREAFLQDSDWYEHDHPQYSNWQCRYCYAPNGTRYVEDTTGAGIGPGSVPDPGRLADVVQGHVTPRGVPDGVTTTASNGPLNDALDTVRAAIPPAGGTVVDDVEDWARAAIGPVLPPRPCPLLPPDELPVPVPIG
jgi:hypothetical protein